MKPRFFTHQSAFIDPGAEIGAGTKIWHSSHIMSTAKIGQDCTIGQNCFVAGVIGNGCKLQNNVNVYHGVTLGNWVFCGPSMTFTNVINPRAKYSKNGQYLNTIVKDGASLGAHATILCGITIGSWSLVGAGSIVTKDVPDYAIVLGNPARFHGWICECGEKLPDSFKTATCQSCRRKYQMIKKLVKQKL